MECCPKRRKKRKEIEQNDSKQAYGNRGAMKVSERERYPLNMEGEDAKMFVNKTMERKIFEKQMD